MKIEYINEIYEVEDPNNIEIEIDGENAEVFLDGIHIDTFYIEDLIRELVRERINIIKEA